MSTPILLPPKKAHLIPRRQTQEIVHISFKPHLRSSVILAIATLFGALPMHAAPAQGQNTPSSSSIPLGNRVWKMPTAPSTWTINFRYGRRLSEAEAEAMPAKVAVTLDGENSHHSIQFRNRQLEVWRTLGGAFISETGSASAYPHDVGGNNTAATVDGITNAAQSPPENPESLAPQNIDWPSFPELAWATPKMFKGKIPLGSYIALIYADPPPQANAPGTASKATKKWPEGPLGGIPLQPLMKALAVDEATGLPLVLQLGEDLREYIFDRNPARKIELPAKVKVFLPPPASAAFETKSASNNP